MEQKIALFDMDGTIADYIGQLRTDMLSISNEELPEDFHSDVMPTWMRRRMELIKSRAGWWANLPIIESGLALMRYCTEIGYGIHVLTQGPKRAKNAWGEKFEWCDRHVTPIAPQYNITITRGGKGFYYGRVLVDDYPAYMLSWLEHRKRGLGLMPATKSNEGFTHPQVVRYNPEPDQWKSGELEDKLQAAFVRKANESIF